MEDAVHDEGDARHVADVLQEAEEEKDDHNLRHEAEDRSHAAVDDVEDEFVGPALLVDADLAKPFVRDGRNRTEPQPVFGGVLRIRLLYRARRLDRRGVRDEAREREGLARLVAVSGNEQGRFAIGLGEGDAFKRLVLCDTVKS